MKSISFTFLIYCICTRDIRQCRRIVKIFYPRRIERIKAFQARLVLDFATGPVSWGTHNDQDDLRRRSVIECLARYQLPLRHRPCNNSRSSEYKVNISCYVSTLYHYLFFFFFRWSGRPKEINDITSREVDRLSFLLCHFRSLLFPTFPPSSLFVRFYEHVTRHD